MGEATRSSRSSVSSLLRPARGGNVRSTLRVVSCFRSGGASSRLMASSAGEYPLPWRIAATRHRAATSATTSGKRLAHTLLVRQETVTAPATSQCLENHGLLDGGTLLQPVADLQQRLILRIKVSPGWEHSRVQPVVEAGHREIVAVCGEPASQQPHRKRVRPLELQGSERIREAIREVVEELRNVPRRRLADEVVLPEQPETSYLVRVSAFRQVPPELVRTDRARIQGGQQRSAHLVIRVGDGSPAQLLP